MNKIQFSENNGDDMTKATGRITVNLTPEQLEVAEQLSAANGEISLSAFIKQLISQEAVEHDMEWPPDGNTWGGKGRRVKKTPQK